MFSTNQDACPSRGTRSSRRRQRPPSTDSLAEQPKLKRPRAPIEKRFLDGFDQGSNQYAVKSEGIDLGSKQVGAERIRTLRQELTLRSKKPNTSERSAKGDGSVVLTSNGTYTVSKLPGLPERLRNDSQNSQHGTISSCGAYALCLTHTHALIWPYNSTNSSPETFEFALPYPSRHASDPLPLGALVTAASTAEVPGLLVVMPVSGKVVYWESIATALTLGFVRQQRSGVEDSILGLSTGEHVVRLVNAESAGFILALSTGRLAHLNVRDSHGRPVITVQFLWASIMRGSGGILGSLRHVLGSSTFGGELAAIKAGFDEKIGERIVIAVASRGKLQMWRICRGGHQESLANVNISNKVSSAIHQSECSPGQLSGDQIEVLDFAFMARGSQNQYQNSLRLSKQFPPEDDSHQHLVLLVSLTSEERQKIYYLVEAVVSAAQCDMGTVTQITSFTLAARLSAPHRPRLHLTNPPVAALVVLDRAVIIASLAFTPKFSGSQDQAVLATRASYEDLIEFREEDNLQIIGSGMEEPLSADHNCDDARGSTRPKTKTPGLVLIVQGVGIVRLCFTDIERFVSDKPPEVSVKSKLEEAVFFGIQDNNPLTFRGRENFWLAAGEIGNAAVQLSQDIIGSRTSHVAQLPVSLESNLKTRIKYLRALIYYLNDLNHEIAPSARWKLLYDAEKLAVALYIWQKNEEFLARRPASDKRTLISETVIYINEQQKTMPNPELGEVDPVRHWFIHDVERLDIFIAWAYQIIKFAYTEGMADEKRINRLLLEAVTVNNEALREAYQFRRTHAQLYDVKWPKSAVERTMPWTSSHFITNNLKRLIEFCCQWLDMYYLPQHASIPVDSAFLKSIRQTLPSLLSQYLTALEEFVEWANISNDPRDNDLGKTYRQTYNHDKFEKILKLRLYSLWDEAVALAKTHDAPVVLAHLLVEQIRILQRKASAGDISASSARELQARAAAKEREIGECLGIFGQRFAGAAFGLLLRTSGIQAVLGFPYGDSTYKTQFLRTKPALATVSWINDIEHEKEVAHAAETLLNLATAQEQQAWTKKIELSFAKLALLAEEQESAANHALDNNGIDRQTLTLRVDTIDRQLEVIKIQEELYTQILPSLHAAVDESAEIELAMKEHAILIPRRDKAILWIFEQSLTRLIKHEMLSPEVLIDLCTLAHFSEKHLDHRRDQFFQALRVAEYGLSGESRDEARKLIWRRCFIRDDWKRVNETNDKDDRVQVEIIHNTATFRAIQAVVAEHHINAEFWPIVKPTDALGAYTDRVGLHLTSGDEAFQIKMRDSMMREDAVLRGFVEKHRFEAWHAAIVAEAQKTEADAHLLSTLAE